MLALFKPFRFLEYFDMDSKCAHCCVNNDSNADCNLNCYNNGVVCECCVNKHHYTPIAKAKKMRQNNK